MTPQQFVDIELAKWQALREEYPDLTAAERFEILVRDCFAPPFETIQSRVAEEMRNG